MRRSIVCDKKITFCLTISRKFATKINRFIFPPAGSEWDLSVLVHTPSGARQNHDAYTQFPLVNKKRLFSQHPHLNPCILLSCSPPSMLPSFFHWTMRPLVQQDTPQGGFECFICLFFAFMHTSNICDFLQLDQDTWRFLYCCQESLML